MSFFLAMLLTGILLVLTGLPLALGTPAMHVLMKAIPRSSAAAWVFFGSGAVWFLYEIWNLSPADFGEYHIVLTIGFGFAAVYAFKAIPDFLAVRGLAVLVLLAASPLLASDYMRWNAPQIYLLNGFVYLCISIAVWMGAQPWRARNFLEWLFRKPSRPVVLGSALALYGLVLCGYAFALGGSPKI